MDFLEYFAFGGLERVAIIGGSLVIGYWGYRLYGAGKPAGLAFMTIACVVLAGALLTGTSHVRSVGESIQLASVPPRDSAVPAAAPTAGDAPSRDRADRAGLLDTLIMLREGARRAGADRHRAGARGPHRLGEIRERLPRMVAGLPVAGQGSVEDRFQRIDLHPPAVHGEKLAAFLPTRR